MGPRSVVVVHPVPKNIPQVVFTERNQIVEALVVIKNSICSCSVRYEYGFPEQPDSAMPATAATIAPPWLLADGSKHEVRVKMEKGRIKVIEEDVLVHKEAEPGEEPPPEPQIVTAQTSFDYTGDGRLQRLVRPDGSEQMSCYADTLDQPLCDSLADDPDTGSRHRPALANVIGSFGVAPTPELQGSAEYDTILNRGYYDSDNLLMAVDDGLNRHIEMAVPVATETRWTRFAEENVSAASTYDPWGRLSLLEGSSDESAGGIPGEPPKVTLEYFDDQYGNQGGGFLAKVTHGDAEDQQCCLLA